MRRLPTNMLLLLYNTDFESHCRTFVAKKNVPTRTPCATSTKWFVCLFFCIIFKGVRPNAESSQSSDSKTDLTLIRAATERQAVASAYKYVPQLNF